MDSAGEARVEATIETLSEIPENIKEELKKKRRRLKEKRSKTSQETNSFDLETIEPDTTSDISSRTDSVTKLPRFLPELGKHHLLKGTEKSSITSEISSDVSSGEQLRPIPPPRKSKKIYSLREITSLQSKSDEDAVQEINNTEENVEGVALQKEELNKQYAECHPRAQRRNLMKRDIMKQDHVA
ncbi:hypothetical protein X975_01511, partial [Stegodyphus mimosarum]